MNKRPLRDIFEAMYHGKHRFEDFVSSPIEHQYEALASTKGSGRRILKPGATLKVYHTFLNLFVFEKLPINDRVVFSYRKGFSARQAVEAHREGRYFYQTDIQSFFDSISKDSVRSTIVSGLDSSQISDLDNYIERILELVCVDGSLPVGFPASAPLSNAVLRNFDNTFEDHCNSRDLIYTRYADDIIVSSRTKEPLLGLTDVIQGQLDQFSNGAFCINARKTKYYQVGGKIKILGMMILPNGRITPDSRRKRELELWLHFYQNDKTKFYKAVQGEDEQGRLDKVGGLLNYMNSIDPDYIDKLRRKFGVVAIDLILHRSIGS